MDRLDLWTVFAAVAEQGSFVGAARRLGRSPAAVSRAVAALEDHLGSRLLTRTTRAVALSEAGERSLELCRRLLTDLEELDSAAAGERHSPKGMLTLTAPVVCGRLYVLPIVRSFMRAYPDITVTLVLLDRLVSFIDEGIDLGIRIGQMPDSSLRAIRVGSVRRVVCASPAYLADQGCPRHPRELSGHRVVAVTGITPLPDHWLFHGPQGEIAVSVKPRLIVTAVEAALDAAVCGDGLVRLLSYQTTALIAAGALRVVLAEFEPPPAPIHIVYPAGRHLPQKVRMFIDQAVPRLRQVFADS